MHMLLPLVMFLGATAQAGPPIRGPMAKPGLDQPPLATPDVITALDVRYYGASGDGGTLDAGAVQAAIDALEGGRGVVTFGRGTYNCGEARIDAKRAVLRGAGAPGNSGGGGTTLVFTGLGGVYSSVADTQGFSVEHMTVRGAGPRAGSGQVLIDFSGQGAPKLNHVRVQGADIGIKLATARGVEADYGTFFRVDVFQCAVGVWFTSAAANSNHWYGGRFWNNGVGVRIDPGLDNVTFHGVDFECGHGATAVDSAGSNVAFFGVRWETNGVNVRIRRGAGLHWFLGDHWSSGVDIQDENDPGVARGVGAPFEPLIASSVGQNLVANGSFEHAAPRRGDEVKGPATPAGWTYGFSSAGSGWVDLEDRDVKEGLRAARLTTGTTDTPMLYQVLRGLTPGASYTLRGRIKVLADGADIGRNRFTVGNGSTPGGTDALVQTVPADGAWHLVTRPFRPNGNAVTVGIWLGGSEPRTVLVDAVAVVQGEEVLAGHVPRTLSEDGGAVWGHTTFGGPVSVGALVVGDFAGSYVERATPHVQGDRAFRVRSREYPPYVLDDARRRRIRISGLERTSHGRGLAGLVFEVSLAGHGDAAGVVSGRWQLAAFRSASGEAGVHVLALGVPVGVTVEARGTSLLLELGEWARTAGELVLSVRALGVEVPDAIRVVAE